ncbi:MAG: DUF4392 domain-containing protein [Synergistaceae bacterium]|jgi:hypothetical protein|nr:DUF4392 domain-containing protein [Synergistaceae bacterium]
MTPEECEKRDNASKKTTLPQGLAAKLTGIAASGATGRGPSSLCRDELWERAVHLIVEKKKIALVSGFYVPSVSAPETDGPSGSLVLARALLRFGRETEVWTDGYCLECYKKCADVLGFPSALVHDATSDEFRGTGVDLLIFVERLGRASDGAYYNMRREDISAWTPPLDSLVGSTGAASIGIGDGGNEVGMGCLADELAELMPEYAPCLCVVRTDICLPVDVSNWGAYALASALSSLSGVWLGSTSVEERLMLEALAASGAVDGVSRRREASVDGLPLERHVEMANLLKTAAGL